MHAMTSESVATQMQPLLTELRQLRENMVTNADLEKRLAELRAELMKWMFGALLAQAALVVALIKLLP